MARDDGSQDAEQLVADRMDISLEALELCWGVLRTDGMSG